ncbi:MAG: hypothetical protein RR942_18770 [Romboutsia sp.]
MDLKISDLPPQFGNIATKIGIDITKVLFEEFGGTSVNQKATHHFYNW